MSGDGRGSLSIYGKHFEDENLTVEHNGPGLYLTMIKKKKKINKLFIAL